MAVIARRTTTAADSEFCFQVHKAALGEYIAAIWGWAEQTQRGLHDRVFDPERWQVITADNRDIGVLVVQRRRTETYLARIEIHPDHQGHLVGTNLITALINSAEQDGHDLVVDLHIVNRRARALCRRLGMTEVTGLGDNTTTITMRSTRTRH